MSNGKEVAKMDGITQLQSLIYEVRGHKVMLDNDLARLYEVEVKRLNEAAKRNIKRFPADFMFQLTETEWGNLKSQIATSSLRPQFATLENSQWGGRLNAHDDRINQIIHVLNNLIEHPKPAKRIGFHAEQGQSKEGNAPVGRKHDMTQSRTILRQQQ